LCLALAFGIILALRAKVKFAAVEKLLFLSKV